MNKKIAIIIGLISLLLVAYAPSGTFAKKKTEAAPPDLSLLDIAAWDETVYKLVLPPTKDGNAMAYFLEAIHFAFEGEGETGSKMEYEWWKDLSGIDWNGEDLNDEQKALIAEAIKIPELDLLVKGSLQKDYRWVGVYAMPSPRIDTTIFQMKYPRYMDLLKLARVLMARAEDKLEQGDIPGAEADLTATLRMGHIMQKDITFLGYMLGMSIEIMAAKKMPKIYRMAGDEAEASKWEEAIPVFENHKDAARVVLGYYSDASPGELATLADNTSLPRSVRVQTLPGAIGNEFMSNPVGFTVKGPSRELEKFLLSEHFDDPEMVIIQLKVIEDALVTFGTFKNRRRMLK